MTESLKGKPVIYIRKQYSNLRNKNQACKLKIRENRRQNSPLKRRKQSSSPLSGLDVRASFTKVQKKKKQNKKAQFSDLNFHIFSSLVELLSFRSSRAICA